MSNELRGLIVPVRQGVSQQYDPGAGGYVREYTYAGFDSAAINALARRFEANGCGYDLSYENGRYTLRATDTTNQVTIDTWEVGLNKLSLPIQTHPTILSIIENAGDSQAVIAGIKEALEGTADYADIDNLSTVDSGDEATLHAFLDEARQGADTFYLSSYTLRHTTNVSNRYQVNVADIHVDTVYTTAQLLSETQGANAWVFPLPGRLAFKLQTIAADFIALYGTHTNRLWGWLKSGSPESTVANNRVDIVTEYEFGEWSTLKYPIV
jgi:hypothetical protein